MPVMKTPGVYIVEKNAFPNSIVEVATAVPAFVGYTEFASDGGKPLTNKPFRISSLAEFERYFGGPPPAKFDIAVAAAGVEPDFKVKVGDVETGYSLTLAATTKQFRLYYAMRHFYQNQGGACWIVSVGGYRDGDDPGSIEPDPLTKGIDHLELEQEPTMLVIPDAVELGQADCITLQQAMLTHCGGKMKNRFAILDVWGGYEGRADGPAIKEFRGKLGVNNLMYGAAYYPWIRTRLVQETGLSYLDFQGVDFADILHDMPPSFADVLVDAKNTPAQWTTAAKDEEDPADWVVSRQEQTHKALYQGSATFQTILSLAARKLNLMPPSAAMAGLYTMVDNSRGVWKAPANVSINNAVEPAVSISHDDQENLNVDPQGKSINAIRSFIGEGVLVWGARTLDGNSLDWRYVNVRRTMIMLEESCKLAAKAMVFEPNVAGTWLTIKSMIQNFLTGIWRRGGLMGAVPDDAFSVHCGLGETMTPEDVLEGILRVTVLVAMVRPAEFIEITFQQQMPKS